MSWPGEQKDRENPWKTLSLAPEGIFVQAKSHPWIHQGLDSPPILLIIPSPVFFGSANMHGFVLLVTRRTLPRAEAQEVPQAKVGREGAQVKICKVRLFTWASGWDRSPSPGLDGTPQTPTGLFLLLSDARKSQSLSLRKGSNIIKGYRISTEVSRHNPPALGPTSRITLAHAMFYASWNAVNCKTHPDFGDAKRWNQIRQCVERLSNIFWVFHISVSFYIVISFDHE